MLPVHRSLRQIPSWKTYQYNNKTLWITIISLLTAQCIGTFVSRFLGGPLPFDVTNTDLLYRRALHSYTLLFFSIKLDDFFALLLAVFNAVLLTTLLGFPDISRIKFTRKQAVNYGLPIVCIILMRMSLGYLFGRGTGWAYPTLFFNDSIHETTYGFSVIILYLIAGRAYGSIPSELDGPLTSCWVSLLLWLPNALMGPIFFWSFSTISVAGIQGIIFLLLEGRGSSFHNNNNNNFGGTLKYGANGKAPPSRHSRLLCMVRYFLIFTGLFALISHMHSIVYQLKHHTHAQNAENLPERVFAEFLILSYPRRANSTLLSSTLRSYTASRELSEEKKFIARVYTTASLEVHPGFAETREAFKNISALTFYQDANPAKLQLGQQVFEGYLPGKQTFDLYAALDWVERDAKETMPRYVGIMEDDFEWCDGGWKDLRATMYEVYLQEQERSFSSSDESSFCGLFVATGGSGLLVRPSVLPLLRSALKEYAFKYNPDIIIQDCLVGELPMCSSCRLAASRRLLFRHTGASESTYKNRTYPADRWQCGWRQPFNGRLGVWVP